MKKVKSGNNSVRNLKVIAENNTSKDGFNIFLEFSGQREYLMTHRHNGLLYNYLKDGVEVADVRRLTPGKIGKDVTGKYGAGQLYEKVHYLVSVIDSYLIERAAC